jgi:hypothetical protein
MASVFNAILKPMSMTARLMACIMDTLNFLGIPPLKRSPNRLPAIIATALTMVPNKFNPPKKYDSSPKKHPAH